MASLEIFGMDDLNDAFGRIAEIPGTVTTRALNAMAEIAAKEIKASGESMGVRDPESDVHILEKIKPTKVKITESGGYQDITFSDTRKRGDKRESNAVIAFVNEYGTRNQSARPFIGQAMQKKEKKIAEAGGEIIGDWIEKEFTR